MAGPSFVGASSFVSADPGVGTYTPEIPGVSSGDMLFMLLVGAGMVEYTTVPAGWSLLASNEPIANGEGVLVLSKRAVAADANTFVTVQCTQPNGRVCIFAYTDCYGVEAVGYTDLTFPGSTSATSHSLTTTRPNELIIEILSWRNNDTGTHGLSSVPATSRINSAPPGVVPPYGFAQVQGVALCEQPQTTAGSTPVQTFGLSSPASWYTIALSLYSNDPPNAPTLIAPPSGSSVNVAAAQEFDWTFSDPDPADAQSAFDWRASNDGGTTWAYTVSKDGTSGVGNLTKTRLPAATFTDGDSLEWQVRTYDLLGRQGPWSSSFFFTAAVIPDAPTITSPGVDSTVGTPFVEVDWSFGAQQAYRVRLSDDDGSGNPDLSHINFDSGEVEDPTARTLIVPLTTTGIVQHILVSVEQAGLWSDEGDARFTVDFDAPPAPSLTLTTNDTAGAITCYVTNPAPGGGELDTVSNSILVSADNGATWNVPDSSPDNPAVGLPVNGQWTWWAPASGVDYQFRGVAYTAAGSTAYSDRVDAAVLDADVPDTSEPYLPGGGP